MLLFILTIVMPDRSTTTLDSRLQSTLVQTVSYSELYLFLHAKTYQNREEEKNAAYRSRSQDYYGDALNRRTVT